ncbi:ribonuclease HII [Bifidobacterium aerophilum]|uniref:Ribonuclease n=1 Tax=Bifidobacterium aerophilum TaxID=1798155 RepID=A0A6N9Z8F7_9BIFI|nr:ribonuclease HII [Bifidobacterium aerophilum]NEG90385.1 ribonuclease HII [Bifidobacterium aerophilum]
MAISEVPTLELERELAAQGADLIIGFDEVGRGALAGPVMVGAAAIRSRDLPTLNVPDGVADSKMLTEHRREAIFEPLQSWCAAWAIGQASNREIDEWGIGYALGVAALRAVDDLEQTLGITGQESAGSPVAVAGILDGPYDYITKALGTFDAPAVPVAPAIVTKVKGDRHCATVATAAVLAKVTRDRLMVDLAHGDPAYAPYAWDHNKGYGSAAHRDAIAEYGPSDLHRVSWKLA